MALFASINFVGIICIVLGIALCVIEMFYPGFGVPGIAGIACIVAGIVLQAQSWLEALLMAVVVVALLGIALAIVVRSVSYGRLSRSKIILKDAITKGAGYVDMENLQDLVGKTGVTLTDLRPAGVAMLEGRRIDVVTDGEYVRRDIPVVVLRAQGRQVLVRVADTEKEAEKEQNDQ